MYEKKQITRGVKPSTDYYSRLGLIKFLIYAWCIVIFIRLVSLQIINPDKWISWANKQHNVSIQLAGQRGQILDRNGQVIAVSVPASSVFIRPGQIKEPEKVKKILSTVFGFTAKELKPYFAAQSPFVWIRRQIPGHLGEKIEDANLQGLGVLQESRRYYPFAEAASTLIGKVGIDGNGLSGLEARYEKILNSQKQTILILKDAFGKKIHSTGEDDPELTGKDLQLTIDMEFQQACNHELQKTLLKHKAKKGIAILLDAETGELLALSQAPAANFNESQLKSRQDLMNYAIQAVYEPGSTFKPIVAAIALNKNLVHLDEIINTENGAFRIGRNTVKDVHGYKELSVQDVVVHSSNVGMSKIAFKMTKEELYQALRDFGFGQPTNLKLAGEGGGILRNYKTWAEIDFATHSFGQGVAVTALQLSRAFAALVNGGYLPNLELIKDGNTYKKQVLSPQTSQQIRDTLVKVVTDGTGKNAEIDGLIVGGKTGTAQKARTDGRGYDQGAYLASFIGFADGSPIGINKRLVALIMIDEPHGGSIYGGTVAAPAFRRIMKQAFYLFGVRGKLAGVN